VFQGRATSFLGFSYGFLGFVIRVSVSEYPTSGCDMQVSEGHHSSVFIEYLGLFCHYVYHVSLGCHKGVQKVSYKCLRVIIQVC